MCPSKAHQHAVSVQSLIEGDMGVYGIAVMSIFSSGILVILILMCGITVSSSPAVCGFSSFWLTVFGKRRSFTVLQYRINVVENSYCTYIRQERPKTLTANEYTISDG